MKSEEILVFVVILVIFILYNCGYMSGTYPRMGGGGLKPRPMPKVEYINGNPSEPSNVIYVNGPYELADESRPLIYAVTM